MDILERYRNILGISPDASIEELDQAYDGLLGRLSERQSAMSGNWADRDEIEQQLRDAMEAHAYLVKQYEVAAGNGNTTDAEAVDETPALAEEDDDVEREEPEPSPPLVNPHHLKLLSLTACGFAVCAIIAVLLVKSAAWRQPGSATPSPVVAAIQSPNSSGAVQEKLSTATGASSAGSLLEPPKHPVSASRHSAKRKVKGGSTDWVVSAVVSGGQYTFYHLRSPRGETWAALPRTAAVRVGDRVRLGPSPQILGYRNPALGMAVDRMLFPSSVLINGRPLNTKSEDNRVGGREK